MNGFKWYVVKVISGKEKKVKDYLKRELVNSKLEEYLPEILIPSEKVYQIRKLRDGKTKKVAVEKKFFPGYLIIKADLGHGELLHTVKNIPGVLNFLSSYPENKKESRKVPQPMRESEINRILGKVKDIDEYEIKDEETYTLSEMIKIIDGPFSGFTGTVEEIFEDKKKLNVMVKIFGRNTPLELHYKQVSKETYSVL